MRTAHVPVIAENDEMVIIAQGSQGEGRALPVAAAVTVRSLPVSLALRRFRIWWSWRIRVGPVVGIRISRRFTCEKSTFGGRLRKKKERRRRGKEEEEEEEEKYLVPP
ncbi:hypothetical protein GW17_00044190 [Ensete ventricosum]|nr:hypothetical protein GW17_00044190 [Ensete ventricosum]